MSKRKSKPTSRQRNERQKVKERYSKAREDAQLAGIIETTPEGALKSECVDPRSQSSPALPEVVRQALEESWATPDCAKPAIVAALLEPFYREDTVLDKDGNEVRVKPSAKMLNELAKTLRVLDQTQWERDNPGKAGQAKGSVGIVNNISIGDVFEDIARDTKLILEGPANSTADSNLPADSSPESLDAPQSVHAEAQSEAD